MQKVVVITCSTSGYGLAATEKFKKEGYWPAIASRNAEKAEKVAAEQGFDAGQKLDVRDNERSHRTDQECFYNYLQYSTYEELKEKMAEWLNRYNNKPHSALRNREGKRVWLTPLQKRAELLEDYKEFGFRTKTRMN